MKLIFSVNSSQLQAGYQRVKVALRNHDHIIFAAMEAITNSSTQPFVGTADPTLFLSKYEEIESRCFTASRLFLGNQTTFMLFEEILSEITNGGGSTVIPLRDVLSQMYFVIENDIHIALTESKSWVAIWPIELRSYGFEDKSEVVISLFDRQAGDIVPPVVVQYIGAALQAFKSGLNAAVVAMMSIAVEATLRDMLSPKGYSFQHTVPAVDVYKTTKATIKPSGSDYLITLHDPTLQPSSAMLSWASSSVEIQVRRQINIRKHRTDLQFIVPSELVEHWSTAEVEAHGQPKVGGLGTALKIAREKEALLEPKDLPPDLDTVLTSVRNNAIHLSGDALSSKIDIKDENYNKITLGEFLNNPVMVYDFVMTVSMFINKQYLKLKISHP